MPAAAGLPHPALPSPSLPCHSRPRLPLCCACFSDAAVHPQPQPAPAVPLGGRELLGGSGRSASHAPGGPRCGATLAGCRSVSEAAEQGWGGPLGHTVGDSEDHGFRGARVALSVQRPTSAQVTISRSVSLSPASGSELPARRPLRIPSLPISLSLSLSLCPSPAGTLSQKQKEKKKKRQENGFRSGVTIARNQQNGAEVGKKAITSQASVA